MNPLNCFPSPQQTCGEVISDACVSVGNWPSCFRTNQANCCYRQIDFNAEAGYQICTLVSSVASIVSSIDLSGLTGCIAGQGTPGEVTIAPVKTTVEAEFQNIYDLICGLQTNLDIPLSGIDYSCLVDRCGTPIGTLGQLLQTLVDYTCENVGKNYTAVLTQTGTTLPNVSVLTNTLDLAGTYLVWSYTGVGVYTLTATGPLVGAFTTNKTIIQVGDTGSIANQITATKTSASTIVVTTGVSGTPTDGILAETSLIIKVYP